MDNSLLVLTRGMKLTGGAEQADILACEMRLSVSFPAELVAFLRASNGGEGLIGDGYLAIYSIEAMLELNPIWWEGWPDRRFVVFGSDGGGESYVLDRRCDPASIVEVPSASADPRDQHLIGAEFSDLLRYVRSGRTGMGLEQG